MGKQTKEYFKQKTRESYYRVRYKVLEAYGNKCFRCGFADIRALQIDHVNGGGCEELREKFKKSSRAFLYWLIKEGFPKEYQVLCANCNIIKRIENNEHGSCGKKVLASVWKAEERL